MLVDIPPVVGMLELVVTPETEIVAPPVIDVTANGDPRFPIDKVGMFEKCNELASINVLTPPMAALE